MAKLLARADHRPRIHIWPENGGERWSYSNGPTGIRIKAGDDLGIACTLALMQVDDRLHQGAVLIIEHAEFPEYGKADA